MCFLFCFLCFISGALLSPAPIDIINIINIIDIIGREEYGVAVVTPATNNYFERREREGFEAPLLGAVNTANNCFIGGLFVALFSAIKAEIVGLFAANSAALLSIFIGIILGLFGYGFGYTIAAKKAWIRNNY